jgi:uncharacterized protein YlxW (UPF0749 family)
MNLTGKIFVVLIFVMSLVFMTMTIMVYSTHTNWKEELTRPADQVQPGKPLGVQHQLAESRAKNAELQALIDQVTTQIEVETNARNQQMAKLSEENRLLVNERAAWEAKEAGLTQDSKDAVAAMNAAHVTLQELRTQVDGLQDQLRTAETDRDTYFNAMVQRIDELHQVAGELNRLKSRAVQLGEQIARMKTVLAANDLSEFEDVSGVPPSIDGVVKAVRQDGLIEISVGSDEGLQRGHRLEVFRHAPDHSRYLGAIRVIRTDPDKSVAQIIPETLEGNIEIEDRVATRIR